jgi:hypothetical protein
VAAVDHYADRGIEVGSRAAAYYCMEENQDDLANLYPGPYGATHPEIHKMIEDGLIHDAAILMAERAKK